MPDKTAAEALGFAGTYPLDERFWVPSDQANDYPWRFGDLVHVPNGFDELTVVEPGRDGAPELVKRWHAAMVVHPTCDLGAKGAPEGVQVVRVRPLTDVDEKSRPAIITGVTIKDGIARDAFLNLIYLAGVPGSEQHAGEMCANLRTTARIPRASLEAAGRIAAMTHEARVAVLAREARFRYRWGLRPADVFEFEQRRISRDPAFTGPRPDWAPLATS